MNMFKTRNSEICYAEEDQRGSLDEGCLVNNLVGGWIRLYNVPVKPWRRVPKRGIDRRINQPTAAGHAAILDRPDRNITVNSCFSCLHGDNLLAATISAC